MLLTVNHDGKILTTEIVQSSGNIALDRRAKAIAKSAGPFEKFNTPMRRRADQLVLVTRFRFTREDSLEAKVGTR